MADLLEIMDARSSIRGYRNKEIPEEVLRTILEAGLKAPTARNEQELYISVVKKDNPVITEMQNQLNPNASVPFHYGAPVTLFISGSDDFGWSGVDAGIAVENMHLAAAGLGLGSVIIGCVAGVLNGDKKEYFRRKLAIPEGKSFIVALSLGYPSITKRPHDYEFDKQVAFVE